MKKILFLVLTFAISGATAARATELNSDREALLAEITSRLPAAGPAGTERRLIDELEALSSGGTQKAAFSNGHDANIRLIDAVWALGETGGPASGWALRDAAKTADRPVRLNIAAALDKIDARAGLGRRGGNGLPAAHLKQGDILFRKGYFGVLNSAIGAQTVGHVGVYAGYEDGEHMVIEGWLPVRKVPLKVFVGGWPYYGNYTTSPEPTTAQRDLIVDYVREQLGKGYDMAHTIQKGPVKFDCVGLAEAAYEAAGLNPTPDEFETGWGWPLTPTEQYEHMAPNF